MSWRKWLKSEVLMAKLAVLVAVAIFLVPQGICLKTILSNGQCCDLSYITAAPSAKGCPAPCCVAHAKTTEPVTETVPITPDDSCMWTSINPFLVADGLDVSKIASVVAASATWVSQPFTSPTKGVLPFAASVNETVSTALLPGSLILRI